jgi:hypothetical protein
MNYTTASAKLGNRESRKLGNNTYLQRRNDNIAVMLHSTDIITMLLDNSNILTSGGWKTSTTKDRLNTYSGVSIHQDKGNWYVDGSIFYDGIKVKDGAIIGKKIMVDKQSDKIAKMINSYCSAIKKMDALPIPSGGDCWLCSMCEVETGKPLGGLTKDNSHLIAHLKEKYIHGSLIVNALKSAGYPNPQLIYQMGLRDSVVRAVRRYLKRQLGIAR